MLMSGDRIFALDIEADDGSIGSIKDMLLEDDSYTVRWLVVDVGSWLSGRKILLPPEACRVEADMGRLSCALSRKQIEDGRLRAWTRSLIHNRNPHHSDL
jgi:hypothetical protein